MTKKRENRYGIKSLEKDFTTDEDCLEFIFDAQHSRKCSCGGSFKAREGRKQYQCSKCRAVISPLVGTIFERSVVSLPVWFRSILLVHNGISIKGLQREIKTTYKTAFRVFHILQKNTRGDTIDLICNETESNGVKNIGQKTKKKSKSDCDFGISKTKNTEKNITKNTKTTIKKKSLQLNERDAKPSELKFLLSTPKEYRNVPVAERQKTNFYLLTT